jgi:tRNA U38,U39,U40 pseudouridine synthase TruA
MSPDRTTSVLQPPLSAHLFRTTKNIIKFDRSSDVCIPCVVNEFCSMPKNGALRSGFRRYVLAVQYHGSAFLGFALQKPTEENCILSNGTDLRGYVTVERRIRLALSAMLRTDTDADQGFTDSRYENIQVSSRTDRGVHAIKNTFHVDVRVQDDDVDCPGTVNKDQSYFQRKSSLKSPERVLRGLNYYLRRTSPTSATNGIDDDMDVDDAVDRNDALATPPLEQLHLNKGDISRSKVDTQHYCGGEWVRRNPMEEVRILAVKEAPLHMDNSFGHLMYQQDAIIDWHARYSATSRTYLYRIFHTVHEPDWAVPFEWDRSWRVYDQQPLNIAAMREASTYLIGTHDFTSFRATGCNRHSPITTLSDISIHVEPFDDYHHLLLYGGIRSMTTSNDVNDSRRDIPTNPSRCCMVTIRYQGNSFLYKQVRKMTGCLIAVGRGKIQPTAVRDILELRNSQYTPFTAPPHGLFLVNVEHEGITI